jgi:hypothetical protein
MSSVKCKSVIICSLTFVGVAEPPSSFNASKTGLNYFKNSAFDFFVIVLLDIEKLLSDRRGFR